MGSRVAASGNVVWVPGEEGYRGGHGHWEMVGSWDQPVILSGSWQAWIQRRPRTGIRVTFGEATTRAPGVASTTADNEAAEVLGADRKVDVCRG
ncbi:MAG: hypothetical protein IPN17_37275 [Deltaproteobacteria bacterium]|nr:hypothetical protein [Deltaproteobacteria bacterium]